MSVNFSSSYPANTAPVGKVVDVQTLQETFAQLLRNYGTEKGGTRTDALLEVIRPCQTDSAEDVHRKQQHVTKHDGAPSDKKLLNKSELRSGEMNSDYQHRLDRQEARQSDYQNKINHNVRISSVPSEMSEGSLIYETRPKDLSAATIALPPVQQNVAESVSTNSYSPLHHTSVSVPPCMETTGQVNVMIPVSINTPMPMPTSSVPANVFPTIFTVFTPSGRLVHSKEKGDEHEEEKDESNDEPHDTKKQPFAALEEIRLETASVPRRGPARQSKERSFSMEQQIVERLPREQTKKIVPEHYRGVKTMEDILNVSIQDISIQKKGDSDQPNHVQYIHRIAAACEAAAQYAPVRMRINLDHWGVLTLRFFHKAEKLALCFETPSKESAQFICEHMDGLKKILSKRNVKIVDIEVMFPLSR